MLIIGVLGLTLLSGLVEITWLRIHGGTPDPAITGVIGGCVAALAGALNEAMRKV